MPQVSVKYKISTYFDDFGFGYPDVTFKIGQAATERGFFSSFGYTERDSNNPCGGGIPFRPRYLSAVFTDGTQHQFPVPSLSVLKPLAQLLVDAAEVVCVDYVGEVWTLVEKEGIIGADAPRRAAPWTGISKGGAKQSYNYKYTSDLLTAAIDLRFGVFESDPEALKECQLSGLVGPVAGSKSVCSGQSLGISPRRFIVKALSINDGDTEANNTISRQAPTGYADFDLKKQVAGEVLVCGACIGYQGEKIRNLQNLL